jgi:hypothetical protein
MSQIFGEDLHQGLTPHSLGEETSQKREDAEKAILFTRSAVRNIYDIGTPDLLLSPAT